jgi:uncharacterized protein
MKMNSLIIDNLAFAKKHERAEGDISALTLSRLSEMLNVNSNDVQSESTIHYLLKGSVDAAGRHYLHLEITASLFVDCQRCLNEMPINLSLTFNYLIGEQGVGEVDINELDENDDFDLQPASSSMNVAELIEDELLMAMPIAPTHSENCVVEKMQSGEKPNPFAVLKGLIKPE